MTGNHLTVMPREMRMMTERILSLTALPPGFAAMASDVVMFSQRFGLGGFARLERRLDALKRADPAALAIVGEDEGHIDLDGGGEDAWVVAPTLVDLLGELAVRHGTGSIAVANVVDPEELRVALPLAARSGLSASMAGAVTGPVFVAGVQRLTGETARDEPLLWDLLRQGCRIEAALWWRIYALAQTALAPDSVVSRRHAGPLIVTEDGTVIGRKDNDDETDLAFLTTIVPETSETESR